MWHIGKGCTSNWNISKYHEHDCSVDKQEERMEYSKKHLRRKDFLHQEFQVRVNMVRIMNVINYFIIFNKCISSNTMSSQKIVYLTITNQT